MILIKENKSKKRAVFYDGEFYYKTWYFKDLNWFNEYIRLLKIYSPEILNDTWYTDNTMTLKMNEIKGYPANTVEHSAEFFNKIYMACISNMNKTEPYMHGDWVLSNMIITTDGEVKFIDWDNIDIFPKDKALLKLHSDLESAFGENFKRFLNDSSSI